jgi:hypothetical protein
MQQQKSVSEHSKQLQIHAFLWFFGSTTLNNTLHRSIYTVGSIALASQIEPCWTFIFTVLYQYQQNSIIYLDGTRLGCSAAEQKA